MSYRQLIAAEDTAAAAAEQQRPAEPPGDGEGVDASAMGAAAAVAATDAPRGRDTPVEALGGSGDGAVRKRRAKGGQAADAADS